MFLSFPGSLVATPFINSFHSPELGMWLDMTGEGGRLQGDQPAVGSCLKGTPEDGDQYHHKTQPKWTNC